MNTYEERDYYYQAALNKAKAINRELQIDCLLENIEFIPIVKEDTDEWKEYIRCNNLICGPPGRQGCVGISVPNYNSDFDFKNSDSRLKKNQEKYRRKFFKR